MPLSLKLLITLLQATSAGCPLDADQPLFECEQVLELELELPLRTLKRQAEDRPELDAKVRYADATGQMVEFDAKVTTRGHSRLEMCSFPPLSLLMKKGDVKNTLFAGQKKLKIVMPCQRGGRYLEYLRQEYGIYKAYEAVAEPAFRVRMLKITFRDAERDDSEESVAFFIESINEVADRSGLERVKLSRVDPGQLDSKNSSIYELFQFMIANTDWSKSKGPGDEDCCHNGKVLAPPDSEDGWFVLPYDFDQSGIINTEYAVPPDNLSLRSVRQRLYRGRCDFIGEMDNTIALFNERRSEIEAALSSGGVTKYTDRSQRKFVDKFYDIINDEKKRRKQIDDKCR